MNWRNSYCSERRQIKDCPSMWVVVVIGGFAAAIFFTAIGFFSP